MKKVVLFFLFFSCISLTGLSQGLRLQPYTYKSAEIYTPSIRIGLSQLPNSISLKKYCPRVLKQEASNSVGWAVSYAALSTQYNVMINDTDYTHKWARAFDPNFIYSFMKQKEGNWCQNETHLTGALNLLEQYGCKPKVWEPWLTCNETKTFNELTLSVASQYRIEGWNALRGEDIIGETKKALFNKLPVIIGVQLTESFMNGSAIRNGQWTPISNEKSIGGHAMCVIGYDNTKNGGSFEVMNSYGETFGDKGYIWITYKDFENLVQEAYVIKTTNYNKGNCSFGDCLNSYSRHKFENGDIYEGIVKDSLLEIYGSMFYSNRSFYVGQWKKGRKNGSGIFYEACTQKFYKTYYENDILIDQTEKSFGFANSESKNEYLNEIIKSLPSVEIPISDYETSRSVLTKYDNLDMALNTYVPKNNLLELRKKQSRCKEADKKGMCPHDYKKNYNESVKCFDNKDYFNALRLINVSIKNAELFGEDASRLHYQKAQILATKKLYSEAIEEMQNLENSNLEFYNYNLAVYESQVGNYEKAISLFNNSLKITNKLKSESHAGLGYCYLKQNKLNEALNEFRMSNESKHNIDASIGVVKTLMLLDEREKAMVELNVIQKKYPRNSDLKAYLVNCNMNDEKTKGLSKNIRSIKRSKTANALLTLGNYNFKHQTNYKEAESNYKKTKLKDKAAIGLTEVDFVEKSEYSGGDLSNPLLNEISGIDNYKKEKYDLAFNDLIKAWEFKNGYRLSYDGLLCLGNLYLKRNEIKKAQIIFETAIKRSKNNAYAHAGLGYCLSTNPYFVNNSDLYTKAYFHFQNALKVEPTNPTFLFGAGVTEYLMMNYVNAKINLEKAIINDSANAQILNALAFAYSRLNQHDEAYKCIRKACRIDSQNWILQNNAGILLSYNIDYHIQQDTNHTINEKLSKLNLYYDKALTLGAYPPHNNINRGYGYLMANKKDSAIIVYNKIRNADSLTLAAHSNNKGVVYALTNKTDIALNGFNKALEFDKYKKYWQPEVNKDLLLEERNKKEYKSIIYFYLPINQSEPKFTGNLNVPETEISLTIPKEISDSEPYKFGCSEHSRYYLVFHKPTGVRVNGGPKKPGGVADCSPLNK
jgi:tetratricopeptide (TPR) repeat protein